jgi:hypothetical protein
VGKWLSRRLPGRGFSAANVAPYSRRRSRQAAKGHTVKREWDAIAAVLMVVRVE